MSRLPKDLLIGRFVQLRANVRLKVCHHGGTDPAMVFLHGGLGNRFNWRDQYEYFADRGREVLVYDLAGHGDSTPYHRYSLGRHCRDLTRLLQKYGIREPILCCHSYGVPLGLEWANRNEVKGMVLVAGGTHDLDPWWEIPMMKALKWVGRHLFHLPGLQSLSNAVSTTYRDPRLDRFFRESPIPKDIHAYDALEIFQGYNFFDRYPDSLVFQIPVLAITGGNDPSFSKDMGDDLVSHFQRGQHLHLPSAGHLLIAEQAEQVNAAIDRWVSTL
ncbi:alpha/beta hydrolase [Pannus brasiliensis CCIBt3594]|uniref:Alpha/beta hydrolase n=1 Tax=Pannus brasiliensis CCIBt3594 TaxID=1427578 RepID=A0AAW9QW09_9CHRO